LARNRARRGLAYNKNLFKVICGAPEEIAKTRFLAIFSFFSFAILRYINDPSTNLFWRSQIMRGMFTTLVKAAARAIVSTTRAIVPWGRKSNVLLLSPPSN
jgi:hypothetical protein